MTGQPAPCIVLVDNDEAIYTQLTAWLGTSYMIWQSASINQAIHFTQHRRTTCLILVSEAAARADALTTLHALSVRDNVPLLLLCQTATDHVTQLAMRTGVTDLLPLNDPVQMERRIRFFLTLMRRVAIQTDSPINGQSTPFMLPIWKRTLDIVVALTALLLLSPLLLVTAILIKIDSKGPIFFKSKRVGTNYRVFDMLKFRTMRTDAAALLKGMAADNLYNVSTADSAAPVTHICEECALLAAACQRQLFHNDRYVCEREFLKQGGKSATFVKFRNDPRITRLGHFLRNSSIDELPQLFNILRGDMSLVGNRPLPVYEAEKLTADQTVKRFAGPSGLTGLWQVMKRAKGAPIMDEQERIALDLEYVETFSFWNDAKIIYKTFFSLWQKENV